LLFCECILFFCVFCHNLKLKNKILAQRYKSFRNTQKHFLVKFNISKNISFKVFTSNAPLLRGEGLGVNPIGKDFSPFHIKEVRISNSEQHETGYF